MPDLKSTESIYLVVAFIIPGLIIVFFRSQFLTGRSSAQSDSLLTYLSISILYYGLVLPFGALDSLKAEKYSLRWEITWGLLVFVGPAVIGVLLGLNARFELVRRLLSRLRFNPVHGIPSAWDWKFGRMKPQYVLVILTDGTRFAGYMTVPFSFASSDPLERDLYLGWTYTLDDEDQWIPSPGREVLIAAGSIRTIEFFPEKRLETK
jgi:hypothetical protein